MSTILFHNQISIVSVLGKKGNFECMLGRGEGGVVLCLGYSEVKFLEREGL